MYRLKKSFTIETPQGAYVRVHPAARREFFVRIEFENAVIGKQSFALQLEDTHFLQVASSRTFCELKEVVAMKAQGLAQGGSLDNAIVVDGTAFSMQKASGIVTSLLAIKSWIASVILPLLGAPL